MADFTKDLIIIIEWFYHSETAESVFNEYHKIQNNNFTY